MPRAIFVLFILLIASVLQAQQTVSLEGRVTAAGRGQALEGVNVTVKGSVLGATTNENGGFRIEGIPQGTYDITYSHVGYSQLKKTYKLSADTLVNVALKQAIHTGPIISTVVTRADARKSAATFSDIEKADVEPRYSTQDFPELLAEMPSTTFYSEGGSGIGYNYLSIRGFGQRRISVLINGIPQNDPEDHNIYWLDFPDLMANVQSIQVQRGAGNAFYGPAAIGGSINIQTDHFSPEPLVSAYIGAGSFNTRKYSLELNSGLLGDEFVLYGRASNITSDGYRNRAWVDFWSYFLGAARYTDDSSLRLHFYGGPIEDGLVYNGIPKFYNDDADLRRVNWSFFSTDDDTNKVTFFSERRDDEIENFNQPHLELLHEWQLSDNLILQNNFFYIKGYGFFDYDGFWGTPAYFRIDSSFGYDDLSVPENALIRAYVDNDQVGWLPQLTIKNPDGDIIVGAELRYHRSLHWGRLQKGSGLPDELVGDGARRYYEYKGGKDVASVYYHQNYKWQKDFIVQADLQYAFKQYHLFDEKFIGTDFTVPYHFINPRIGVNYNLSPTDNAYFSIYSTTREPRLKNLYDAAEASTPESWGAVTPQFELNPDGSYNFDKPLVEPETLTGIEFGYSYRTSRFSMTGNLYLMDFRNEIVPKGDLDRFGQPRTGNADRTRHYGVELSGNVTLTPRLSIYGNATFSQNELTDYSVFDDDGNEIELDGNTITGFPNTLANLRLTYTWRELYASLGAKYVGKQYTDNFENEKFSVDPYTVLDLSVNYGLNALGLDGVSLQGRVSNLLNSKYLSYGIGNEFFPAATRHYFMALKYEL